MIHHSIKRRRRQPLLRTRLICVIIAIVVFNLLLIYKFYNLPSHGTSSMISISSSDDNNWCEERPKHDESSASIKRYWEEIDTIVSSRRYKNLKVSGGLFLYPRQTDILVRLIRDLLISKTAAKKPKSSSPTSTIQVCETGFGSGHSAALFLAVAPNVKVLSFDKFDRKYQLPIVEKFKARFGSRFQHVRGNSCKTVPTFFRSQVQNNDNTNDFQGCDILHGSSLCPTDNIDLVQHAECGTILTSTAMYSVSDRDVYFGPKAQWRTLRRDRCISDISCFTEESKTLEKSFVFASKNATISHEFCLAIVSGECYNKMLDNKTKKGSDWRGKCKERIARARSILKKTCVDYRIPVPDR